MAEYIPARPSNGRKGSFILVAHGHATVLEGAGAPKSLNRVAAQDNSPASANAEPSPFIADCNGRCGGRPKAPTVTQRRNRDENGYAATHVIS